RAGLVLMPVGILNEVHEPPFFHGVLRPAVEQIILPSTWRELAAGIFGEPFPGVHYRFYVTGGLNGQRFQEDGWREGRQGGNMPLGESFAVVGRFDYAYPKLFQVGLSMYVGGAGQGQPGLPNSPEPRTYLGEGHLQLAVRGLEVRALGAYGYLSG